ncbi:MAG: hypothetical protein RL648_256 [Verrucomicrobiota bacterium]|jgi:uncharacterized alkaline shock family protein YloU
MAALDQLTSLFSHLLHPPYAYYAAVAASLFFLLLIIRAYRKSHRAIVPFKTQGGVIEIAPHTLRSVMQSAAQSVEGVHKCACQHFIRRHQLGVRVTLQLQANHSLRDVDAAIKERIRATLLEQFGMETVDPIHIRVSRIVGKPLLHPPNRLASTEVSTIPASSDPDLSTAPSPSAPTREDRDPLS